MSSYPRAVIHALLASVRPHWGVLLLGILGASLALTAEPAQAGRFHVYSCRTPNGGVAPTEGWVGSRSPESASVVAVDTCASGGALTAGLKDTTAHEVSTNATWTLTIPSADTLSSLTLWRAGDTEGREAKNATYQFVFAGPTLYKSFPEGECIYSLGCKSVGEPEEPLSLRNILSIPKANLGEHFYVTSQCGGLESYVCPENQGDSKGDAAVVFVYAADLLLEQTSQPSVTPGSVGGELATDPKLSGTASVLFEATDPGSGVYQAVVEVDGKVVGTTSLDSNGGHCANVGQTTDGLPAFLYLKPCAATVSADVPLDTTSLSNGVHHIVVSVNDAAGNATTVLDRNVEVANGSPASSMEGASSTGGTSSSTGGASSTGGDSSTAGTSSSTGGASSATGAPPSGQSGSATGGSALPGGSQVVGAVNGTPPTGEPVLEARWVSKGGTTARSGTELSSPWGRTRTITGRLRSTNGAPIVGALLEVSATPATQGARARAIGSPRTRADGAFSLTVPAHACSEQIVVAYRVHRGDVLPVATQTLTLVVPASLSLSVTPRSSHVGGTIHFSGLLRGGPLPAGGKQLVLQASSPGTGWRTFKVLSTNRRGRYRSSYRFRLPGPVTYRFRAVSRREADYPFASGSSDVVLVHER
jgi:hypothetical protein